MTTLEMFRASGRDGRIYEGGTYIEKDGKEWHLHIENQEYYGSLDEMEVILYEWWSGNQ
jgi:hypothetical protein